MAGKRPETARGGGSQHAARRLPRLSRDAFFVVDFLKDVPHGMQGLEALCGQAGGVARAHYSR